MSQKHSYSDEELAVIQASWEGDADGFREFKANDKVEPAVRIRPQRMPRQSEYLSVTAWVMIQVSKRNSLERVIKRGALSVV